jgi:hypothetical protein
MLLDGDQHGAKAIASNAALRIALPRVLRAVESMP